MSTYLGLDVLDFIEPTRSGDVDEALDQKVQVLDTGIGPVTVDQQADAPNPTRSVQILATTRAEAAALRAFVLARKGRTVPFWLPSYQRDLILAADLVEDATGASVRWVGYTNHMWAKGGGRRYIALYRAGVALAYHKVTAATDPGDFVTEGLTLSPGAGTLYPAATSVVMFLKLCRLENDHNVLRWYGTGACEVALEVRELPMEAPL